MKTVPCRWNLKILMSMHQEEKCGMIAGKFEISFYGMVSPYPKIDFWINWADKLSPEIKEVILSFIGF